MKGVRTAVGAASRTGGSLPISQHRTQSRHTELVSSSVDVLRSGVPFIC